MSLTRRLFGSDLAQRIVVAVPAAAAVLLLNHQGGLVWALTLAIFGGLCLGEANRLTEPSGFVALLVVPISYLALAGMVTVAYYGTLGDSLLVMAAALPLLFGAAVRHVNRLGDGLALEVVAKAWLVIGWIGIPLACAVRLRGLPQGEVLVIDVLLATFVGDTAAYLGGRKFGRTRLAVRISPGKTVEGLLCSLAAAILVVMVAAELQTGIPPRVFWLGAVVAVVAPVGDLFESFVKREGGVKDSGRLFGAHGGALDRGDAVLWAMVGGYAIAVMLNL